MNWSVFFLMYAFVDSVYCIRYRYVKFNPDDYCAVTCPDGIQDTICVHKEAKEGCNGISLGTPMKQELRKQILNAHNAYRNDIAAGISTSELPMATNMQLFFWNEELEFMAQAWALQCPENTKTHDDGRCTLNQSEAGQNIHRATKAESEKDDITAAMDEFTTIPADFKFPADGKYVKEEDDDIFVQMIWADTTDVGCAFAYTSGESEDFILVCDYLPKGSVQDEVIYKAGHKPCSECGEDEVCDKTYPNLCIDTKRPTPEPPSTTPEESGSDQLRAQLVHLLFLLFAMCLA